MKTCITCFWWGRPGDRKETVFLGPETDFAELSVIQRRCTCPKVVHGADLDGAARALLPRDYAYTLDLENYSSWFMTGPDFGCVHHSAGPPPVA